MENAMRLRLVVLVSTVVALCGCASNTELVQRHASNSTGCAASAIQVNDLGQQYAGINHYETSGCGIKHRYECPKVSNVVMASIGIVYLDQRRCRQINR